MKKTTTQRIQINPGIKSFRHTLILYFVFCILSSVLVSGDTWQETTTADFNAVGSTADNTQAINDAVQMAGLAGWWNPVENWLDANWQYRKAITINNSGVSPLSDYQVKVTNPVYDETSLAGSWHFDETTGTTAADMSGNGNTGAIKGSSIAFDGTNDYVSVPDAGSLDVTDNLSIEAWIYPFADYVGYAAHPINKAAGTTDANFVLYYFGTTSGSNRQIQFFANAGGTWKSISSGYTVSLNQWTHIVLAYTSAGGGQLYINGSPYGSADGSGVLTVNNTSFNMGGSPVFGPSYFNGTIDEVRIYSRAISSTEASEHYQGIYNNNAGLAGNWHFNDALGSTAVDSSGNGNNGVLTNSPTWSTNTPGVLLPSWIAGKFGNALNFDGINDYVSNTALSPQLTGDVTLSAWVRTTFTHSYQARIMDLAQSSSLGLQICMSADGRLVIDNSGGPSSGITTTNAKNDGIWHHVAAVRQGTYYYFYVDGALTGTTAGTVYSYTRIFIGTRYVPFANSFNGDIDEVRVFSRALSPDEIQAHYNAKAKLNYDDIRFVGNSGTELPYWMEKDGTFWVKASGTDSIPAGLSMIYMYYGNSSAASASNGSNTFPLFDNFDSYSGWTEEAWIYSGGTWTFSNSNSELRLYSANAGGWGRKTKKTVSLPNGTYYQRNRYRIVSSQCDVNYHAFRVDNPNQRSNVQVSSTVNEFSLGTGTSFDVFIGDINYGNTGSSDHYVDWILVRQYVSPEPAVCIGSEVAPNSQWQYRKPVTITNSGTALSDYQIKVENPFYDETGLIGSWHLDGAAAGIIPNSSVYGLQDTSGNNNNGSASNANGTGMQWTVGKFDGAVGFDGVDDYISIPAGSSLNLGNNNFTVEGWFKKNADISTDTNIVSKFDSGSNKANYEIYFGDPPTDQILRVRLTYNNGTWKVISFNDVISNGVWYHFTLIYSNNILATYLNGTLKSSGSVGGAIDNVTAANLLIGRRTTTGTGFNGAIDEIRVYSRALSEAEIQAHYNARAKLNYADVRFAGNSGTELPYWMEKDGTFWMKVIGLNSIPAGSSTCYVYYGNTSATGVSNGYNTFVHFASFETSVDGFTNGTRVSGGFNGTYVLQLPNGYTGSPSYTQPSGPYVWEMKAYVADTTAEHFQPQLRYNTNGTNRTASITPDIYGVYDKWWEFGNTSGTANWYETSVAVSSTGGHNKWYDIKFIMDNNTNGTYSAYAGTTQISNGIYNNYNSGGPSISFWGGNGISEYVDISRIRKYVSPEPATYTGSEQIPFQSSGSFTSAVKDSGGDNTLLNSILWTVSGSGTITMEIRAGNSEPAGWSSSFPVWEVVINGDTSVTLAGRYMQYRAEFSGSGLSEEPVLSDITITYTVPVIPPENSVYCGKLANTWYSTAEFTFTNDAGFGAQINKYYYVWDNNTAHAFDLTESVWDAGALLLDAASDGSWYLHYLPYSSTNTAGTTQDMGPFKYDSTAPPAVTLSLPLNNASISESTTGFTWSTVADLSGVTYTFQLDNYTSFSSPVINKTGLTDPAYTLTGAGAEILIGNSTYYWRVIAVDGAGSYTTNPSYYKFTTASTIPQMINETTGEMYASVQDAINSASTIDGDTISIEDTIAHTENIVLTKDITLENGILSPASGFAVTGQGATGGEILRNCVITSGGISNLALGENLTIFNPASTTPLVIQNSTLINCLIELGTTITNSTLINCHIEAVSAYFADAANNDFHLTSSATGAIDQGKNLNSEFINDADGLQKGVDVLDISNFDAGAWDIGAYEFILTNGYSSGYVPADSGNNGDNGDNGNNGDNNSSTGYGLISTDPAGLNFGADYGIQNIPAKTLTIYNSGTAGFNWTIQTDVDWIELSSSSGSTSSSSNVQVSVTPGDLSPSVHSGTIIIASSGAANSPLLIPVTMVIYAVETQQTDSTANDTLTDQTAPAKPLLQSPSNGQLEVFPPPPLMWMPADEGEASYLLQLGTDQNFTNLILSTTIGINSHSTSGMLKYDQVYYWRVKTIVGEQTSNWSETWWFGMKTMEENTGGNSPKSNACFIKKILSQNR